MKCMIFFNCREAFMMPRNILGTVGKDYSESEGLRSPYYGCTVAHVEPQVLKIYARLLPQAQVAVFGEYEIMILFTYTDAKNNTTCFLQTFRKTFSEFVDVSAMIPMLQGADIADIVAQAEFHPQVACEREKKSGYIWNVGISGVLNVTLSIDEPDAVEIQMAGEAEVAADEKNDSIKQEHAVEKDCVGGQDDHNGQNYADGQDDTDGQDYACGQDSNKYGQREVEADYSLARCWRIGGLKELTFDALFKMEPDDIDSYAARHDDGQEGVPGKSSDENT
jgi:hypothetical protein